MGHLTIRHISHCQPQVRTAPNRTTVEEGQRQPPRIHQLPDRHAKRQRRRLAPPRQLPIVPADEPRAHVAIGKSRVPMAGDGLFAVERVQRGRILACMAAPHMHKTVGEAVAWCSQRGLPQDAILEQEKRRLWVDDAFESAQNAATSLWYAANH